MLIRLGYDIQFEVPLDVPFIGLLNVHPSRVQDLHEPDELTVEPAASITRYVDLFGNRCTKFLARKGPLRLYNSTLIEDSGEPDPVRPSAREIPVEYLPEKILMYLLASRYCEVDLLTGTAARLFGGLPRGWRRVQAVLRLGAPPYHLRLRARTLHPGGSLVDLRRPPQHAPHRPRSNGHWKGRRRRRHHHVVRFRISKKIPSNHRRSPRASSDGGLSLLIASFTATEPRP
jgi:hypothetical protein